MDKVIFRKSTKQDLNAIIALLADDKLGKARESIGNFSKYEKAFELIDQDFNQMLMVAQIDRVIVGTCHLTIMPSLTFSGSTRLNIEAIRVSKKYRNQKIGTKMINEAINYGKIHNASIIQLTTNKERKGVLDFYKKMNFKASHEGMKLYI